jgi:hypothetical protein
MKFITKVYHLNVSSASGAICLDILKDAWSPVLTLKSTLISLQSLLCSPEPNDPQDAEVAKHYMTSRSSFEDTARYWTHVYAGGPALPSGQSAATGKIACWHRLVLPRLMLRFMEPLSVMPSVKLVHSFSLSISYLPAFPYLGTACVV